MRSTLLLTLFPEHPTDQSGMAWMSCSLASLTRMKKILIVEDDQLVATAYRKRFGEAGYLVEWAPDGLEGIKMVSAIKPDVVLLTC